MTFTLVANSYRARTRRRTSWLSGSVRDLQARDRGFDPRLGGIICSDVVLLGKARCPHVPSLDPEVGTR